jgi:hypothetical protein
MFLELGAIPKSVESADQELQRRFDEAYDENGVDRSLNRANLRLTPSKRLANLESFLTDLARVRRCSLLPQSAKS